MDRNFAILGAAGFVAPRHLEAIESVGGTVLAALDPHDSVGILDRYAPNCAYFNDPDRFWRWMARRKFDGLEVPGWVSICSPNWLHDAHMRMALLSGCKVIVEKPAVLTKRNLECLLAEFPNDHNNVFVVHQIRWHDQAIEMRRFVKEAREKYNDPLFSVNIAYHTPRGPWYEHSWKGDEKRSGGVIANLGIHLLDVLCWIFGKPTGFRVDTRTSRLVYGTVLFDDAEADFGLSSSQRDSNEGSPVREFKVEVIEEDGTVVGDGFSFRFGIGFTGLHDAVYASAMSGEGVHLADVLEPVALAEGIRFASGFRGPW